MLSVCHNEQMKPRNSICKLYSGVDRNQKFNLIEINCDSSNFPFTTLWPYCWQFFSQQFVTGTRNFCIKHWATYSAKHSINFSAMLIEACETLQTDWKDLHVNSTQLFYGLLTCRDTSPFLRGKLQCPANEKLSSLPFFREIPSFGRDVAEENRNLFFTRLYKAHSLLANHVGSPLDLNKWRAHMTTLHRKIVMVFRPQQSSS